MSSVPLLCNICPKHPDFSDISHLLTHVSSKGHLSHYFKAQVRSRQEPQILQQLEVYDRWYEKYHIEKLLSRRMILKESKNTGNNRNASTKPSTSSKPAEGTKKPANAEAAILHQSLQIKDEDVIDPQLSQVESGLPITFVERQPLRPDSSVPDLPSRHRAYAPRMGAWPTASPPQQISQRIEKGEVPRKPRHARHTYSESGSDVEQLFFGSPATSIYPDPSTVSAPPQMGVFHSPPSIAKQDKEHSHDHIDPEELMPATDEAEFTQSPMLKGICWPGMDIFDSASPEAQRQRNQKKDDSILRRMELNSVVVEPLEQIFWPEGTLKKERIITGMVESSPLKEESPKPRRRRATRDKGILKNASTNKLKAAKPSGFPKRSYRDENSHAVHLGDISKRALDAFDTPLPTYPTQAHPYGDPVDDENVEWELTAGNPKVSRKRGFVVYDDDATEDELEQSKKVAASDCKIEDYPFLQRSFNPPASSQAPSFHHPKLEMPFPTSGNYHFSHGPGYGMTTSNVPDRNRQPHHLPRNARFNSTVNKENIEPMLDSSGRIEGDSSPTGGGRSYQRYFSVTRGCPPEFFDTLPPEMVFGGWSGPRISGSSFNPLNPSSQHHLIEQPYQRHPRISSPAATTDTSPHCTTATSFAAENFEHFFSTRSPRVEHRNVNPRRGRF